MAGENLDIQSNQKQEPNVNGSGFKGLRNLFKNIFRVTNSSSFKESVVEVLDEHNATDDTKISTDEKNMLKNMLSFRDSKVSDIMIPRTDIVAVEQNISLDELKKILITEEHTRMPVYRESLDNVVGFIHIKDLIPVLANEKSFAMEKIVRELLVISPTMKNIDLLAKMRHSRVHMALVLDEYGGTDGLVTFEDLAEEIFGEIQDEHDDTMEPEFIRLDDRTIEASARLPIDKLEKLINLTITDKDSEDFDTLGGLLLSLVGYVPTKGEKIFHSAGIEFEILDSDPRRVKRIMIHKRQNEADISSEAV
jgi:CBS domain containing-hemolysin-like protein